MGKSTISTGPFSIAMLVITRGCRMGWIPYSKAASDMAMQRVATRATTSPLRSNRVEQYNSTKIVERIDVLFKSGLLYHIKSLSFLILLYIYIYISYYLLMFYLMFFRIWYDILKRMGAPSHPMLQNLICFCRARHEGFREHILKVALPAECREKITVVFLYKVGVSQRNDVWDKTWWWWWWWWLWLWLWLWLW